MKEIGGCERKRRLKGELVTMPSQHKSEFVVVGGSSCRRSGRGMKRKKSSPLGGNLSLTC
jgi:hypothetical protein